MSIKAMILAAGRGERMRPLTDHTPKPLLPVHGKPLMQWPLDALQRGGFHDVVVNTAWLGEQICTHYARYAHSAHAAEPSTRFATPADQHPPADAAATQLRMAFSNEGQDFGCALETAGGIVRALPHLGTCFWVLAGDVYAPDFAFSAQAVDHFIASGMLAHLWLVPNPAHNLKGDFGLSAQGMATLVGMPLHTYSTIGLYHSDLFSAPYCDIPPGNPRGQRAALAPLLRAAIQNARVSAEMYLGRWTDVGTPERLAALG